MEMRIVIVGANSTGCELATSLSQRNQVILLDTDDSRLCSFGTSKKYSNEPIEFPDTRGITCLQADGTSRLVLNAVYEKETRCALVALTGNDQVNGEVCSLGKSIGFDPIIALQHSSKPIPEYDSQNITAIVHSQIVASRVEQALQHKGAIVPYGIGLGRGELLEIRLLATSPVLGRPLKNLAPYQWRVAAIFRQDELIVPTGETVLQENDRVLLVGDPKILPTISEYLRMGTPQFPQSFGPNVVSFECDDKLLAEAEHLSRTCSANSLIKNVLLPSIYDPNFAKELSNQHPGVIVTKPCPVGLSSKLFGKKNTDSLLCDLAKSPVLFARGTFPYRRILLPVSDSELNISSAEMAIDITRQQKAGLMAINVDLPKLISGVSEEGIHHEVVPIRRLCELYEVPLEYRHQEGNPIKRLMEESKQHDLIVMVRRKNRGDSYFNPDIALRVARRAACSVIVLTIGA
jgi:Trk K+ transport system NAD-binding subunit